MQEVTPDLQLRTMFILDRHGRISSTREPQATAGPIFTLIRSASTSAWAIRADRPTELAGKLYCLAREEPPILDPRESPVNADQYLSLCGGKVDCGPAFSFPDEIGQPTDVAIVNELKLLQRNFRGWVASEIPGRSPIYAVTDGSGPSRLASVSLLEMPRPPPRRESRQRRPFVDGGLRHALPRSGRPPFEQLGGSPFTAPRGATRHHSRSLAS